MAPPGLIPSVPPPMHPPPGICPPGAATGIISSNSQMSVPPSQKPAIHYPSQDPQRLGSTAIPLGAPK